MLNDEVKFIPLDISMIKPETQHPPSQRPAGRTGPTPQHASGNQTTSEH